MGDGCCSCIVGALPVDPAGVTTAALLLVA